MQFGLFILVNALLFVRPGDMIPDMADVQLYQYAILVCLLVSLPNVLTMLSQLAPVVRPILLCVLGLAAAVCLAHLSHFETDQALENGYEFAKVVVYFVLFVTLVNTPARMRQLLAWLALFTAVLAMVALMNYLTAGEDVAPITYTAKDDSTGEKQDRTYGPVLQDTMLDPATGEMVQINRMCGVGIFKDPNDLALALVIGLIIALYWVGQPGLGLSRLAWLPLIGLFGCTLALTRSRGGFLALLGGLAAFFIARFGWRRSLLLGLLALPVLLAFFGGRMTDISTSDGTGQSRIQLWSDGLALFQEAPLFGLGMDQYRQRLSFVAHNSYLHCYTELGLFGGTLFLGAFTLALRLLVRSRQQSLVRSRAGQSAVARDPKVTRLYPLAFAVVVAYMTGILFLSRAYVVPTYTILGVAAAYLGMAEPFVPRLRPRLQPRALVHLAGTSVVFLGGFFALVRLLLNWG
jgi:hypothetical protein